MPFVDRVGGGGGMADGDEGEGDEAVGEVENVSDGVKTFLVWVEACPHGAKSQSMGAQEYIFTDGREILLPERAIDSVKKTFTVATRYDSNRSPVGHFGVG